MSVVPAFDPRPLSPGPGLRAFVLGGYPAIRAGLRSLLESAGLEVIGEGVAVEAGVDVDVAVADVTGGSVAVPPDVPAVVLGEWRNAAAPVDARTAARAWLQYDASGAEIAAALGAVVRGLSVFGPEALGRIAVRPQAGREDLVVEPLTPREQEVLELMAQGLPNKGIALALGISEHTAKFHVGAVLSKLGAASRAEAVTVAVRSGILAL